MREYQTEMFSVYYWRR